MQSLNFDDGLKGFAINGDESRVIRFNPADPDLIKRYQEALQLIKHAQETMNCGVSIDSDGRPEGGTDASVKIVEEINGVIRDALKLMFNADVYDAVFAGQSPFALTAGGKYLFEAFMESLLPIFKKEIKEYQKISKKRMDKYLSGYGK